MRRTLCLAALLLAATVPAAADTLLTMKSHTDGYTLQGKQQPPRDSTITLWIGKTQVRHDESHGGFILDTARQQLVILNHPQRTYSVLPLPIDLRGLLPPGAEPVYEQMVKAMEMTAKVEPTDETRKIGRWNARRWKVTVGNQTTQMAHDVWVSKEVPLDLASWRGLQNATADLQPGGARWLREIARLDGFPVYQESRIQMMGTPVRSTRELVAAEEKAAPPGTYAPPKGYKVQPYNPLGPLAAP